MDMEAGCRRASGPGMDGCPCRRWTFAGSKRRWELDSPIRTRMRDDRAVMSDPAAIEPRTVADLHEAGDRLRELAFLHDIAQVATLARDWDELMRTIVEGTTAAMGVEVCSFYLADRDGRRLTLEGTNGLDRSQVGKVSLAFGEGVTGRVAETPPGDRDRRRHQGRSVQLDPRLRCGGARRHAVGAADLARRGGRRPQRPDPRRPAIHRATRSTSCARSRPCSPGSSRRAG